MTPVAETITTTGSVLPTLVPLVPMMAAFPVYAVAAQAKRAGAMLAVATGLFTAGMAALLLAMATRGGVEAKLSAVGYGIFLRADAVGASIALVGATAWSLALLFSLDYMEHEHSLPRYWAFMIFAMGATLGVFLAGDLFTLFVFFEMMTFASYALVVHNEDPEALSAGRLFLFMGVASGLCLVFAVMVLSYAGGMDVATRHGPALVSSGYLQLATILVVLGFGVKAGVFPLHIWLPRAHPVAPAPASAVLSGVLIKAGAYGLLRMFLFTLVPGYPSGQGPWALNSGALLLGMGLVTLVSGGIMAVFQDNAKRILAYSSVSQVGYIVTGIGAATVLGAEGVTGFGGAFLHILNHMVFKAAAFLMVGYLYMITHETSVTQLSGMRRYLPASLAFLAVFGAITGLPGFSGFASKTLIHHALAEAYHETHLAWLLVAEKVFVVGTSLTVVYFLKIGRVFLGSPVRQVGTPPRVSGAVLHVFSLLIILVGLFPQHFINLVVLPAAVSLGYQHGLDHLAHADLFHWANVRDVMVPFVLGTCLYIAGLRMGLLARRPPNLSVESLVYKPLQAGAWGLVRAAGRLERSIGFFYAPMGSCAWTVVGRVARLDRGLDQGYQKIARRAQDAASGMGEEGLSDLSQFTERRLCDLNVAILLQALTLTALVAILVLARAYM